MDSYYFKQQDDVYKIEDVFDVPRDERLGASSYGYLAPVYDLVYKEHWDYDEQYQKVKNAIRSDGGVVELGCGTGRLLKRLETDYTNCIGVDYSISMLRIAEERVSSKLFKEDIVEFSSYSDISNIVSVGRVISNIRTDERMRKFGKTLVENTEQNTIFVFDTFLRSQIDPERTGYNVFENDRFRVRRESKSNIPEKKPDGVFQVKMEYTIYDKKEERSIRASEKFNIRGYDISDLRSLWENYGVLVEEYENHEETATFKCFID